MSPIPRRITLGAAILLTLLVLASLSARIGWGHLLMPLSIQNAAEITSAILWCVYADGRRYAALTRRLEEHQTNSDMHSLGLKSGQQQRHLRRM